MRTLLADLGGTRLKTSAGAPMAHGGDWVGALQAAVSGCSQLALCVPGIVDGDRVVALPGKLPGIVGADLAAVLGVPVPVLVNDAVAYGLGEALAGAGRGFSRVLVVTLGTGVGVCVVEDGAPLGRGPLGGGVLGGQLPIGRGGVDTSGRGGTVEALCRASALVSRVPGAVTAPEVYARTDELAVQAVSAYRSSLVQALTALALTHAPDCVVVGGGAASAVLLEGVEADVQAGLWAGQSLVVRLGELGDDAALRGLAALAAARVPA